MEKIISDDWITLKDYPDYQINRFGQLRNVKTGAILLPQTETEDGIARRQIPDKNGVKKVYILTN